MVHSVDVHEAKTHFSKILERVIAGEVIIIAKAGKPVAKISRLVKKGCKRVPGTAIGQVAISGDFDEPLPEFEVS